MAAKNRRLFELRLGKLGLTLFIGGMSLLLFSMFVLGIMVGKQMEADPDRFSPDVAGLIRGSLFASATDQDEKTALAETEKRDLPAGEGDGMGFTFYETLGGKTGEMPGAKSSVASREPSPALTVTGPSSTGGNAAPASSSGLEDGPARRADPSVSEWGSAGKMADPVPERQAKLDPGAPFPEGKPAGAGADTKKTPDQGRFQIQVAAYQESGKADQVAQKLMSLGFASQVMMKDLPGKGRWFRVIVGGFKTREKAKAAADRITGKIRGVKCVILSSAKNSRP